MTRPLILITTGRNIYSLRAYDAIRIACETLKIQYDVAHVEEERLTAVPVRALLASTLCRTTYVIKSDLIKRYRLLSKHAAHRDIRPEIDALFADITPKMRKANPKFTKAMNEAPWIYTGHGIFSKPFIDQTDPRLIQYNQISLLQYPAAVVRKKKANFMMLSRGGILGESRMATDSNYLPRVLSQHLDKFRNESATYGNDACARGEEIIKHLKANKYTEHQETSRVPKTDRDKAIFVPLHCAWDAQMLRFSPLFGNNVDFLRFVVDNSPEDVTIIVKAHPKADDGLNNQIDPVVQEFQNHPRVKFTKANIHDIFPKVCAVITLNSSVGVEAIPYFIPVVVLGKAFYSHIPDVTFAPLSVEVARHFVKRATLMRVDPMMARLAVDYLWNYYLVPIEPADKFNARVKNMIKSMMPGDKP